MQFLDWKKDIDFWTWNYTFFHVSGHSAQSSQHNLSTSSGSVSQRSTPSPIKEEPLPQYNGYHNGLPPASGLLRPPAGPGPLGPPPAILPYNPACIQVRRDSIDVEAIIHRNLTLQPPPEVMASVRIGAPPPNQVIHFPKNSLKFLKKFLKNSLKILKNP